MPGSDEVIPVSRCVQRETVPSHIWFSFWELWAVRDPGALLPREGSIRGAKSGSSWMELIVRECLAGRLPRCWPKRTAAELHALCWCAYCGVKGHTQAECTADPADDAETTETRHKACPRPTMHPLSVLLAGVAAPVDPSAEEAKAEAKATGAKPALPDRPSQPGRLRSLGRNASVNSLSSRRKDKKKKGEKSAPKTRGGGKKRRVDDSEDEGEGGNLSSRRRARGFKVFGGGGGGGGDKNSPSPDRVTTHHFGGGGGEGKKRRRWFEDADRGTVLYE